MQTDEPRQGASATVFVAVVAMVIVGIGTVELALASAPGQSWGTTGTATNSTLGLRLSLVITPGEGPSGTAFGAIVTVTNILARTNNVTGLGEYGGVARGPICSLAPISVELLQGRYSLENYTSGTALNLQGPSMHVCAVEEGDLAYYVFQPESDNFTGPASPGAVPVDLTAGLNMDVSQAWLNGASLQPLPPGLYTVVAADGWGQLVTAYFKVS